MVTDECFDDNILFSYPFSKFFYFHYLLLKDFLFFVSLIYNFDPLCTISLSIRSTRLQLRPTLKRNVWNNNSLPFYLDNTKSKYNIKPKIGNYNADPL